ncbi:MAG: hypothetical protein ONB44_01465 [candidate division KSB1 bacterium]|nr:hypothetical protein [candidate division KSB1 bacterium]MDZ7300788.1 hypothetical protein [candidate division KSB1 bacterium]MDZ7309941.1 hypothetical protein [candidate division KSB1 bacterium]
MNGKRGDGFCEQSRRLGQIFDEMSITNDPSMACKKRNGFTRRRDLIRKQPILRKALLLCEMSNVCSSLALLFYSHQITLAFQSRRRYILSK